MSFVEEWARLKTGKAPEDARMQLNHALPPDGATGKTADGQGLAVKHADLGEVGHEGFLLHRALRKKADIAAAGSGDGDTGSTARAAQELSACHLTMGDELSTTLEMWTSQVKTVLQMCAHISNHLDYSKKAHAEDDAEIGASLRHRDGSAVKPSEILKYVK